MERKFPVERAFKRVPIQWMKHNNGNNKTYVKSYHYKISKPWGQREYLKISGGEKWVIKKGS